MKYVCFHGHFYQPPRENPWLEVVEHQPSAAPWHDWNERVTAESYLPNSAARIVDDEGIILDIVNNYERMSFNFGPTLLSWLEYRAPETYERILEADRSGAERFSGHGPAIAQAYNHLIMPLAGRRDQETQIRWGIADFRHRFGRDPEGMWLPETAVDVDVLEMMAAHGIRYTILEPGQIAATKLPDDQEWVESGKRDPDTRHGWHCPLPSGGSIAIFLYDGPTSRAVAFEDLLASGEKFVERLLTRPSEEGDLIHVATDGETYGHHHRFGEMALAWATRVIEGEPDVGLTIYGEHLDRRPPVGEVKIAERTSWSCSHGIGRWSDDCGCHTGGEPGWNQKWRKPLRDALDWLRDSINERWEERARDLFDDPWRARNDYIDVILDRREEHVVEWLRAHGVEGPDDREKMRHAMELLEIQRHAMLMYTSCGWFFNDVAGIETVQILRYAARAIQLSDKRLGLELREGFLDRLALAESNLPEKGTAADVYRREVETSIVELRDIAAHQVVSAFFQPFDDVVRFGSYQITWSSQQSHRAVGNRLIMGEIQVESVVTRERAPFHAAVLHTGGLQFSGGLRPAGEIDTEALFVELKERFESLDLGSVIRTLDREFPVRVALDSLFTDKRRSVTQQLREHALQGNHEELVRLYEQFVPVVRRHHELELEVPLTLKHAAEIGLNMRIRAEIAEDEPNPEVIRSLAGTAEELSLSIDHEAQRWPMEQRIERIAAQLEPDNPVLGDLLDELLLMLRVLEAFPIGVDLWDIETALFPLVTTSRPEGVDPELLDELARSLGFAPTRTATDTAS